MALLLYRSCGAGTRLRRSPPLSRPLRPHPVTSRTAGDKAAQHQSLSALLLKADICSALAHVWFVPIADIRSSEVPSVGVYSRA